MSRRKALLNISRAEKSRANNNNDDFQVQAPSLKSEEILKNWGTPEIDNVMRRKYTLAFANSMFGIFLMVIELQASWDGTGLIATKPDRVLRVMMSCSTILLLFQIVEYYRSLLMVLTSDWQSRKSLQHEGAITPFMVLRSTPLAPLFWSEFLICCIHPIPWIGPAGLGSLNIGGAKWGLVMWARLYMFARIFRDYSTVYRKRRHIANCYPAHTPPKFNWVMSVKYHFSNHPILVMVVLSTVTVMVCSHWVYIFEREVNPQMWTFAASVYVVFISLITGWPTDTYDYYNPSTFLGRGSCIMACIMGLFLLACIIELIGYRLFPTPYERPAINWVACYNLKKKVRHTAAIVIQVVWRHHRYLLKRQKSRLEHGFQIERGLSPEEERYMVRFMEVVRSFHRAQRVANSLEAKLRETQNDQPLSELTKVIEDQGKILRETDTTGRVLPQSIEERIRTLEETQSAILIQLESIAKAVGAVGPPPNVRSDPSISFPPYSSTSSPISQEKKKFARSDSKSLDSGSSIVTGAKLKTNSSSERLLKTNEESESPERKEKWVEMKGI